jgi:hypothetical protein
MKKLLKQALALASLALLSGAAAAQITNTPHNFTASGGANNVAETTGTDQICVFCHTPHGSDTTAAVPLWNKTIPSAAAYQTYNSIAATATSSIDGEIVNVGSVSAACLSCHDGTQAMDNMMNAPGSGTGLGVGVSQGYTWTDAGTGGVIRNGIANLDQDLTNDHPIGIEYCGGGITTTTLNTCGDKDFIDSAGGPLAEAGKRLQYDSDKGIFWVDTAAGTVGTREKGDIALFTRSDFTAAGGPSVECASCHDPHKAKGSDDVHFMRVATAGSAICLACHVK